MFGLGIPELLVIGVIALLVFGPKRLPDLGRSVGRAMAEFKKASQEFQDSVKEEMKAVEKTARVEELAPTAHEIASREQIVPRGVPGNEYGETEHAQGDAEAEAAAAVPKLS